MNILIITISRLPGEIATIVLSLLPVAESRVSVPLAITAYHLHPLEAVIYATLGGILATAILLSLLEPVTVFLIKHFSWAKKFFNWLFDRTRHRFRGKYERYGLLALVIFVAAPIPGSGVWAGSLAAYLFGLDRLKAFIFIAIGAIIASSLVALATLGFLNFFDWVI